MIYKLGISLFNVAGIVSYDPNARLFGTVSVVESEVYGRKVINVLRTEFKPTMAFRESKIDFSMYALAKSRIPDINGICVYSSDTDIRKIGENFQKGFILYISQDEIDKISKIIQDFRKDFDVEGYIGFGESLELVYKRLFNSMRDYTLRQLTTVDKTLSTIYITKREYDVLTGLDISRRKNIGDDDDVSTLSTGLVPIEVDGSLRLYYRRQNVNRRGDLSRLFLISHTPARGAPHDIYALHEVKNAEEINYILQRYIRE